MQTNLGLDIVYKKSLGCEKRDRFDELYILTVVALDVQTFPDISGNSKCPVHCLLILLNTALNTVLHLSFIYPYYKGEGENVKVEVYILLLTPLCCTRHFILLYVSHSHTGMRFPH